MEHRSRRIGLIAPKIYPVLLGSSIDTFGGAEVALSMVAGQLSKYPAFEVHVLVGDYGQQDVEKVGRLTLHRCLHSRGGVLRNALKLLHTIGTANAGVYIQRTLSVASAAIALHCRLTGRRFIYWVAHDGETDGSHALYKRWATAMLVNFMYRLASHVVVQNSYERQQLEKRIPGIRCTLIKKGILAPASSPRAKPNIDAIWVGRCDEWKNPEAFIQLARKSDESRFVMICPPAEGKDDYHSEVRSEAAELDNLEFRGRTANAEVLDLVSRSRVFCITSSQEGDWPNVVLEAASLRVPVLSLAINYEGLIDDFGGGRFCDGSDARLLAEFQDMLRDPGARADMGEGAYRYVRKMHDLHKETEKLIGLLDDIY